MHSYVELYAMLQVHKVMHMNLVDAVLGVKLEGLDEDDLLFVEVNMLCDMQLDTSSACPLLCIDRSHNTTISCMQLFGTAPPPKPVPRPAPAPPPAASAHAAGPQQDPYAGAIVASTQAGKLNGLQLWEHVNLSGAWEHALNHRSRTPPHAQRANSGPTNMIAHRMLSILDLPQPRHGWFLQQGAWGSM